MKGQIITAMSLAAIMSAAPLAAFAQIVEKESGFEEQDLFSMLDEQTKKLYNDAIEALNRQERTLAVMYMEKALARIGKTDPRYKIVLKGMVICYQQLALYYYDYDEKANAIQYFNKIVSMIGSNNYSFLEEKADESYAYLGKIYYDKGDRKNANKYLNILKSRDASSSLYWRDELADYMSKQQLPAKQK